jgi:15-cis-phytoene synthase
MSTKSLEQTIFERGSTTYYFSSKLFPRAAREDIFRLYSFVRVADDYVDAIPQKAAEFTALCRAWDAAKMDQKFDTKRLPTDTVDERVIKNIVHLVRQYKLDQSLVEAFLASMQADVDKKTYKTLDESLGYVYGSAEVIGLMISTILGLPEEALPYARLQGRAMQWINFLRDINEDTALGRQYFPTDDLALYHLEDLKHETALGNHQLFIDFVRMQLAHYNDWQAQAAEGYRYIPERLLVPIKTAAELYTWTALQIQKDPFKIYDHKIKPSKQQLVGAAGIASRVIKK